MESPKIKVLVHSNYSRMVTGFGKNAKNILLGLFDDPRFEVAEAANGLKFGADLNTPWKFYGTYPSDPSVLQAIESDAHKKRIASYGGFCIDQIVEDFRPDIYLGIEDIWAFREFENKPWWNDVNTILWTTLDSLPIIDDAKFLSKHCDKMLVWASFAEKEMKSLGLEVETLHGAVDYSDFYEKSAQEKFELKSKYGLQDNFVIGFVFKNQLRKSVGNLLDGFKKFKSSVCPEAKLLLHTDWADTQNGWNIPKFLHEKNISREDVLCCYSCDSCGQPLIYPYNGEDQNCPFCSAEKSLKSKSSIKGLSESQLNDLYNVMDVYCHPFTSGGQELPIQEAKAAGLITLVTEYSCGTDSCYPEQGGLPLDWSEYREIQTQFIKATTDPESIFQQLSRVYNMPNDELQTFKKRGLDYVKREFSCQSVLAKLKDILLSLPPKSERPEVIEVSQPSVEAAQKPATNKRTIVVADCDRFESIIINAVLHKLKRKDVDHNLFVATHEENFPFIEDNKSLSGLVKFKPSFLNEEAVLSQGYFDSYINLSGLAKHKSVL